MKHADIKKGFEFMDLIVLTDRYTHGKRRYIDYVCTACGRITRRVLPANFIRYPEVPGCKHCNPMGHSSTKHGRYAHRTRVQENQKTLNRNWINMMDRCEGRDPKGHASYIGVHIDPHWLKWENYRDDMLSMGWRDGLEMHRKIPELGYTPHNVILVTKEQHQALHAPRWELRRADAHLR